LGDIPSATQTYRQMVSLSRQAGHSLSTASALSRLAWFLHQQGHRSEAVALSQQALNECVDARGKSLPVAGLVHLVLGMIHHDTYELAQAHRHVLQAIDLGEPLGPAGGVLSAKLVLAQVQQALGQDQAALATIQEVRQTVSGFNMPQVDAQAAAAEADIQLKQGKVVAVERWAEGAGLSPTDWPNHMREAEYATYARLLLAQKRPDEAQTLLDNFEQFARNGGRQRNLITVHVLQALAQQGLELEDGALACLEKAVRLASPEGYRRAFVEEGAIILDLLPQVRHVAPDFVDQVLGFARAEPSLEKPSPPGQPLVEPLSERELQVLRLVAAGLSNREIAERLIISVGTVKTHAHNIYGKLNVRGRTQAVARARELDLI
jgi:LuxR family maltose regulon positive regulatory protein